MIIDFSRLAKTTPPSVADVGSPVTAKPLAPIEVSVKIQYDYAQAVILKSSPIIRYTPQAC